MEISLFKKDDKLLLRVRGRFILDECDLFKDKSQSLLSENASHVYVDMKEVEFIDSAGLGSLVGFKMNANKHKIRLVLLSPSKTVNDILYVSKLDSIFDVISGSEADLLKASLCQEEFLAKTR